MGTSDDRRVDEKGRVTIPRAIREALQIGPGEEVAAALEDGRVVIQPRIDRERVVEALAGCIDEDSRAADAPTEAPADLKADWTSDLP